EGEWSSQPKLRSRRRELLMSVTTVFRRLQDDALRSWLNNQDSFDEKAHPDSASIQLGVESMAVADLVARAINKKLDVPEESFLFRFITGTVGTSANHDGDQPRIITADQVSNASTKMDGFCADDLRSGYDLERLQREYPEIEEWRWEELGPDVLEDC